MANTPKIGLKIPSTADNIAEQINIDTPNNLGIIDTEIDGVKTQINSIVTLVPRSNGVDDTQSILNAISEAAEGTTVKFNDRVYRINTEIVIEKNINLDFNGCTIECYGTKGITCRGALKGTFLVTSDYVETTSHNSLVLNTVAGIEIGNLINVISTELYDTSRTYYCKGGNAIVTEIIGNTVYFNLAFPFNMSANSITVKIYKPITVSIENIGLIIGKQNISTSFNGLSVEYGKNISIENVTSDNFQKHIFLLRCVNSNLHMIDTGHSKNSTADVWDGYGVSIGSCTNVRGTNIVTNSGQHGLTWGNREVNFGLHFEDCVFKSEVWDLGVGSHDNLYDAMFINVKMFGASLSNNITCINCDMLHNNNLTKSFVIGAAEDTRYANFKFDNCRFYGHELKLRDYKQQDCPTRKYVGSIIFNNCSDVKISITVNNQTNGVKIAEVDMVSLSNMRDFSVSFSDKIDTLIIRDSESTFNTTNAKIIQQRNYNLIYQLVNKIIIENLIIPVDYNNIELYNVNNLIIKNLKFSDIIYTTNRQSLININKVYIENTDISALRLTTIQELSLMNCYMAAASCLSALCTNSASVLAKMIKVVLTFMDITTATDGNKYKIEISTTGTQTVTLVQ